MPYNQPFIALTNSELQRVKNNRRIKLAFIDALTYFHDGLCEFLSNPTEPVYPHFNHINTNRELYKCMQAAGTSIKIVASPPGTPAAARPAATG